MGEMKSAFEKAMERVDKIGSLSPEEMRHRQEAEYTPVGHAVAGRYLEHGNIEILKEEVDKHGGSLTDIVRGAAVHRLVESIDLAEYQAAEKALNGMLALVDEGRSQDVIPVVERMAELFKEFGEGLQGKYESERERVEKEERELLHQLRISGSAVGDINMAASESWGKLYREFAAPFNDRLGALKQELLGSAKAT